MLKFYQGATYRLPFNVTFKKGWLKPEDVLDIEFYFGPIIKRLSEKGVQYDDDLNSYTVKLNEEDTLKVSYKRKHELQIRVVFLDGSVKFSNAEEFEMEKTNYSQSRS